MEFYISLFLNFLFIAFVIIGIALIILLLRHWFLKWLTNIIKGQVKMNEIEARLQKVESALGVRNDNTEE